MLFPYPSVYVYMVLRIRITQMCVRVAFLILALALLGAQDKLLPVPCPMLPPAAASCRRQRQMCGGRKDQPAHIHTHEEKGELSHRNCNGCEINQKLYILNISKRFCTIKTCFYLTLNIVDILFE